MCTCGDRPGEHEAVVLQPICIDQGNRVLFEGTLGGCHVGECNCVMYMSAVQAAKEAM